MDYLKRVSTTELYYDDEKQLTFYQGAPFSGISEIFSPEGHLYAQAEYIKGSGNGYSKRFSNNGELTSCDLTLFDLRHGYHITYNSTRNTQISFSVWDIDHIIELLNVDFEGKTTHHSSIVNTDVDLYDYDSWITFREKYTNEGLYNNGLDIMPFYALQCEQSKHIIMTDILDESMKYVAGVCIVHNELEKRFVCGIVILDVDTLECVDTVIHEEHYTFPYVPGLISYREVPVAVRAYRKLKIKPKLLICNGHGIAHPKGYGFATHLGMELNVPALGCVESRIVGAYQEIGSTRGSSAPLIFADKLVGKALVTKSGEKPVFISCGHKISLETAEKTVLKLTNLNKLPVPLVIANELVDKVIIRSDIISMPVRTSA